MKRKIIRLLLFLLIIFLISSPHLFAEDAPEHRIALVIGNAEYQLGKLANPENDARDVAEALMKAGFTVQLALNCTLAQMEDDLRTFRSSIQPGDVAMLYYAGHGVQVEGENYLLPVDNAGIADQNSLKRRAINAAEYIQAMADAGSRLNIVVVDACRDNPLPAVARGGSRGLSVMRVPSNTETVIVFATKAGELALDGAGRNSTFTEAFLEEVQKPDTELMQLFNSVGSRVREKTKGKQVPSIYSEPLSKPFVFVSSAQLAAQAEAASRKAQAELKTIEDAIAQLEAQIKNSKDAQERQKLEVEQQRQKALEAAKRIEAQNLAQEAARKQEEARKAQEQEALRQQAVLQSGAQQKEVADLAAKRRAELEKLAQDAQSDNPDVLIETIERLEAVIDEVSGEYASVWKKVEPAIRNSYAAKCAALETAKPELWETDAEFAARIKKEKADLQADIEAAVAQRKKELDADEELQIGSIRKQYADTIKILENRTWILQGSAVNLRIGEYDRNARKWLFTIASADPSVPVSETQLYSDLNKSADIKQDVLALDAAVKANALAGRIEWGIKKYVKKDWYTVILKRIAVTDLVSGKDVATLRSSANLGYFAAGERLSVAKGAWVSIKSKYFGAAVYEQGRKLGDIPCDILLSEGTHAIEAKWPDGSSALREIQVQSEENSAIFINKHIYDLVYIEGGDFKMGLDIGGLYEKPVHTVTLSPFYIGKYEVTQDLYQQIMYTNPSYFKSDPDAANLPVENITWYDALLFCNRLSQSEGLEPAYYADTAFETMYAGGSEVYWKRDSNGYRLPTEAEWEYAAKGGKKAKGYLYSGSNNINKVAWYSDNSERTTHPVAQKVPNELGLYDMSGNVWEWCWDWYDWDYYGKSPGSNPIGPDSGMYHRVIRGGSWYFGSIYSRIAFRNYYNPVYLDNDLGFRVARSP
jgi:sulfatase modifying factor 1